MAGISLLTRGIVLTFAVAVIAASSSIAGQAPPDPRARIAAQKEAMTKLAILDGAWRGQATTVTPSGKRAITQTERVGPALDGSIRVIEGRGYEADGTVAFNAFAVISYDPDKKAYSMRSYAQGRSGDFPVTVRDDGFSWEIAAGPMKIQYVATVKNGAWHEAGYRVPASGEPIRFFEMALTRIGDTDWPAGGGVKVK